MKTGIFGGTFNPIHLSHLYVAGEYRAALQLDRVLFIPTSRPPHKSPPYLVSAAHRLEMCRLAVREQPAFAVCDYETAREGPSYTWKTLQYLAGKNPKDELYLLMGADMFFTVQNWVNPEEIFRLATLCAAAREPGELERLLAHREKLEALGARCRVIAAEPRPLSSTLIRQRIAAGEEAGQDLPEPVWSYIQRHGLYEAKELEG